MLKLARYLSRYRVECVLAPLFKLLEAVFELLVPLVMANIIDVGIASGDRGYVYSHGLLLVGMAAVGLASAAASQYFSAKIAAGFGTQLRNDLFAHIMRLSRRDVDILGRATLVTRMTNDSNQIQDGVNMFFRLVLRSPFIVFGAMGMAYYIDGLEGLLFTVVIAVLFVIVFAVMRVTVRRYRTVQDKLDVILSKTSENLEGVRVIRAFLRERMERASFAEASNDLANEQIGVGRISALMNPATYVVVNLGLVAVLQTGGVKVDAGAMSQGEVVALVNYVSQILVELVKLANLIILLAKASACANRVNDVFETRNSMADGSLDAADAPASVEFRGVGFTYPDDASEAVSDISFKVSPGQTIGIIGGTGSGKSTLASLIMRFYDAGVGTVLVGGHDVRDYRLSSLRRRVGIVEQEARLFSGTIASGLRWGDASAGDDDLEAAVATAQAAEVVAGKSGGLSAQVEQLGRNFSGGQRQRLSIARTLVRKPSILILDDSSSALDFATDAALRRSIRENCAGATLFLISQRVSTIRRADEILVLDDGRLVGKGTHEELLKGCGLYREICSSQLSAEEVTR